MPAKKAKRWTEEDVRRLKAVGQPEKKGRYGNVKKIEEDGHRFDSKREYLRYLDLKLLLRAGEIKHLEVHPEFPITIGGVPIMVSSNQHQKWDRHLTYEADFKYAEKQGAWWPVVIEDVKMQSGHRTGIYKIKRALMRAMGYDIREY
jgi:hypothetical protein